LEGDMQRLMEEKGRLEQRLADPALYADDQKDQLKRLLLDRGRLDQSLAEVEEAWLMASEQLEAAEQGG
jgi:ATP-binding cassette subfamily F protein 3